MACNKCENPEVFPPFPGLEGVLAMDIGELGMTIGAYMDAIADDATRSINEYVRVEVSYVAPVADEPRCISRSIPNFFNLFTNSARIA